MPNPIVKKKRGILSEVDRKIKALNRQGMLDYEISKHVGLNNEIVRRRRTAMGLPNNYHNGACRRNHQEYNIPAGELVARMPKQETDWKSLCKSILGDRLRLDIRPGYHTLDGIPALTQRIIDTANRIAPMLGKPHIGKKPNEMYKPRLVQNEVRV